MTKPVIPTLPAFPVRGEDRETFATKANAHVAALTPWSEKIDEMGDYVDGRATAASVSSSAAAVSASAAQGFSIAADASADIAAAAANFKGSWSLLTGALSTPSSVYHSGSYWMLLSNIANVTTSEPGTDASFWAFISKAEYTPTISPSISSDFTQNEHKLYEQYGLTDKTINTLWDVTRASTATYVDAAGVIREAAINEPRITYDSETGECLGLLVEESRTNLLPASNEFDNVAQWGISTDVSFTTGVADPFGGTNAYTVTASASTGRVGDVVVATSGLTYTGSIWIRRRSGSIPITLTVGDAINQEISVTTDWQRLDVQNTTTTTTTRFYINLEQASAAVDIYGAQLEAGSTPSSYIPTTTAAVTRAADDVSRTLGSEIDVNNWTAFLKLKPLKTPSANDRFFSFIFDGLNRVTLSYSAANGGVFIIVYVVDGTSTNVSPTTYTIVKDEWYNVAIRKDGATVSLIIDGGVAFSATAAGLFTVSPFDISIGKELTLYTICETRNIDVFPRALSDAELQELTK